MGELLLMVEGPDLGPSPAPGAVFDAPTDRLTFGDNNRTRFDHLEVLAASMRELGQLSPIIVRPDPVRAGSWRVVAGESRSRAALSLGWPTIRAIRADDAHADDASAFLRTMAENVCRADPPPLDEAAGYVRLRDAFGMDARTIAARVGVPERRVRDLLTVAGLDESVRHAVATGELSVARAVMLAPLDGNRQRLAMSTVRHAGRPFSADEYGALVDRLIGEQSQDSMFDLDAFLQVEEYVADAVAAGELARSARAIARAVESAVDARPELAERVLEVLAEPAPSPSWPTELLEYVNRLVHAPKRAYAVALAAHLLDGAPCPTAPDTDWADAVARKVRRWAK